MSILNSSIAFRDYDDFVLLYDGNHSCHLALQDAYAEFFRLYYIRGISKENVVKEISSTYKVDSATVSFDFDTFLLELGNTIGAMQNSPAGNNDSSIALTDRDVYDFMTTACIPFSATIEICDACNENCIHCYRGPRKKTYWGIEEFDSALSQLRDMGCMHLTLTGGEPLSHPCFLKFIELIKLYGFVLSIQTNGTLFNEEILSTLTQMAVKSIAVSLYSVDPQIHDSITRVPGSCKETIKTIRRIGELGLPVSINMPVMTVNYSSMKGVRQLADEVKGECNYSFKIIPSQLSDLDTNCLNCFSEDVIYDCMSDPTIHLYENIIPDLKSPIYRTRYCDTCFRSITLDAQGNVLICNAFRKRCGQISNLPLRVIWKDSSEINHWRSTSSLINDKCKQCKAFAFCEPCPAHNYTKTGSDSAIDELTCSFGKAFYGAASRLHPVKEGGDVS